MEIKASKLAGLLGLPKNFKIYRFEIKNGIFKNEDDSYIIEGREE